MKRMNVIVVMSLVILLCLACSPGTANESGVGNGSGAIDGASGKLPLTTPEPQPEITLYPTATETVIGNGSVDSSEISLFLNDLDPRTRERMSSPPDTVPELLRNSAMSESLTESTAGNESYVFVTKWGSDMQADGRFYMPSGVAVDSSGNVYVTDAGNDRIQKFSSTGTFLAKWGSNGTGDGQFYSPRGVAVDSSGNVYVADSNNNRIQKFSSTGTFLAKWGSSGWGDGKFRSPLGVAVDSSDNVYVADGINHRIQKFGSNGSFLLKWGTSGTSDGQFYWPHGITVDLSGNVYVADRDNHRIQKFSSNGIFLAKWGTFGSGDNQFNSPEGVAIDSSGNVYVADAGNDRILKFSSTGTFLAKWGSYGTGDGQFYNPQEVAVDSSGNVYVVDTETHRIQKFSSTGTFLAKWGGCTDDGAFTTPCGVAVDSSGNVYVADLGNGRIQKFSSTGTFLAKWGSYGTGDGQFYNPQEVAVDSSGNVYVVDTETHRIQKFSSTGTFLAKWGSEREGTGDGQFQSPRGVAVDSSGNVYVADVGNDRIQKFSSTGTFLAKWGSEGTGDGQFQCPGGVAVDSSGNVYVADVGNDRIQKFSSTGTFLAKWGSYGTGDGQFHAPHGVAVDLSGNVYVANAGNDRIQKFSSTGTFLVKWGVEGTGDKESNGPGGVAVDSSDNVYVADTWNNRIQKFSPTGSSSPTISSLTPSTIIAGSNAFTLEVAGTNFASGAKILWQGQERATVFVSSTKLTATILKGDVATAGTYKVKVVNPDGKGSGEVGFAVTSDAARGVWKRMNASGGWSGRFRHSSVAAADGSIVLMGGLDANGFKNDTWRSTNNGVTWTQINASGGWSAREGHTCVKILDGSIVLMGGEAFGHPKNDVWRSTDNGSTWTNINSSAGWSARAGHNSVAVADGSIILMGGEGNNYMNDVWRSTDNGSTWTQVNASAGWSARSFQSSVAMPDGSIVLMGGSGGSYPWYKNDVWRSIDSGEKWKQMTASAGWSGRSQQSSISMPDGNIVLAGGWIGGEYKNDVWRSTDNGATWTNINPSAEWTARRSHSSVAMMDGSVVLMGGDASGTLMNDTWRLVPNGSDPSTTTIDTVTPKGIINTGSSKLVISGTGFKDTSVVQLQYSQNPTTILGSHVTYVSSSVLYATFDFAGVTEGYWDIRIQNPGDESVIKNHAITVSKPTAKPKKEAASITITNKIEPSIWIDPVSTDNAVKDITYRITPNDCSGHLTVEIFNNNGDKISGYSSTTVSGGVGSITWDGKVNGNLVNPANNPYKIRLRLTTTGTSGLEDAYSEYQKIFVGRPVLFVHGINALASDIEGNQGYKTFSQNHYTIAVEYADDKWDTFTGNIPQFSEKLGTEINRIKEETGAKKVDIVSHSMGGLISRYYIEREDGRENVGKLIMIQTPNHGSDIINLRAYYGYYKDAKTITQVIKWLYNPPSFAMDLLQTTIDAANGKLMLDMSKDYYIEKFLEKYDTFAAGQIAPHSTFLRELNANEEPYECEYYAFRDKVIDKIGDPSGYTVIASTKYTLIDSGITVDGPTLTHTYLLNHRLPAATTRGDGVVPYLSAELTDVNILGAVGSHMNPWENQDIMNHVTQLLSLSDLRSFSQNSVLSDYTLNSGTFEASGEYVADQNTEFGFWSNWIFTNLTRSEDVNLTFNIEPETKTTQFFFEWDDGTTSVSFIAPNGTTIDTGISNKTLVYRVNATPGTWQCRIHGISIPVDGVNLTVGTYQENSVFFGLIQDYYDNVPGDAIPVYTYFGTNSTPYLGATVIAYIAKPDQSITQLSLYDDGTSGDKIANDGIYSNLFTNTSIQGTYRLQVNGSYIINGVPINRTDQKYITLKEYPDLSVNNESIQLTPAFPVAGDRANISATISNIGAANATNVTVNLYDEINSIRYLIKSDRFNIPAGQSANITSLWKVRAGTHTIVVIIGSCDEIVEYSYSNNVASKEIFIKLPEINLESANITVIKGETERIPIIVTNCTDLTSVVGSFSFNGSIVKFIDIESRNSSINHENTTNTVRFNITYPKGLDHDIHLADIIVQGVGDNEEGTETTLILDLFDSLNSSIASLQSSKIIFIATDDSTPLLCESIAGLTNVTYAPDYITWTWTDPATADFSGVIVYLDNIFQKNVTKGIQTFNATDLSPDSMHTLSTHTYDTVGNVNLTWVNNTARTKLVALVAGFAANITSGKVPLTVQFNDTSTGSPTSWNWSFDDGALSTAKNPVHTYIDSGSFTVSLNVTNSEGWNLTVKDRYLTVFPKGDFNQNGEVDIGDVARVAYMVVGRTLLDPSADFNGNGEVDVGDAAKIAWFSVGKITDL